MFGINCNRTRQSAKRSSATFYGDFDAPFDAAFGTLISIGDVLAVRWRKPYHTRQKRAARIRSDVPSAGIDETCDPDKNAWQGTCAVTFGDADQVTRKRLAELAEGGSSCLRWV